MEGGLTDTYHGRSRQRARGVEASVVEARDDVARNAPRFTLCDLFEHAGHGQGLVVEAFDRLRPARWVHGSDARRRRGHGLGNSADPLRHRGGSVAVDDQDFDHGR